MEIRIEKVHGAHYQWKFYVKFLKRPICEGSMIYPDYSTCVEDAKRFRRCLDSFENLKFKCLTCKGLKKVEVCDTCYERTPQVMQRIDSYPKLIKCFNCGKGKPKVIDCPDCHGGENSPSSLPIVYETPTGLHRRI